MDTEICKQCGGRGDTQRYDEFEQATVCEPCKRCKGMGHHGRDSENELNTGDAREALESACRAFSEAMRRMKK